MAQNSFKNFFASAGLLLPLFGSSLLLVSTVAGQSVDFERIQLSDSFYSEGGTIGDFDGDQQTDLAVGPWIYFGPDFVRKTRFYEGDVVDPIGYSNNFLMFTDDVNEDGRPDIFVLGFPGKESWWYENPGAIGKLWSQHTILDSVDNESPLIADIDGDGAKDLICSSRGHYGFATRAGASPDELWKFIPISPNNGYQRFTHGLGVGDVNNDGHQDLMEKNGWWQNPGKPTDGPWTFHAFQFSNGGAQMHAVDLNGDGRNEVVTGMAAHGFGLVYYQSLNEEATQFEQVAIMTDDPSTSPVGIAISQLHASEVADINADGIPDIVTGKRWWAHANKDVASSQPATLVWLETQRKGERVQFIPHVVDISSGVGTQITVGDVNGDGLPDIVSGSKRGAHLFLQKGPSWDYTSRLIDEDTFGQQPAKSFIAVSDNRIVAARNDRALNFDFESDTLADWEIRGTISSIAVTEADQSAEGPTGKFVDTGSGQLKAVGEIISRPFELSHAKLHFQLGGLRNKEARVELVDNLTGKVLRSVQAPADAKSKLSLQSWDIEPLSGRQVRLRIIDHADDAFVLVDDFHFSD